MRHAWRFAAALLLVAGSCSGPPRSGDPELPRQKVKKLAASVQMMAQELSSFGALSYRSKADITATVEGVIAQLAVEEGAVVAQNQLLARLRNIQVEMRRDQAQSALKSALSEQELALSRLWEGERQVEARILSLRRAEIELEQKQREQEELAKTLANKEVLHRVGGTTEEAMASLQLSYAAAETNIKLLEKDLAVKGIGLRDLDILSQGIPAPPDEAARTRALELINTRILTAELEVARARVESARTDLRSSEQLVAELEIRAPSAGIVGARYVEPGEHVQANARLFTLIDTKDVYAVFALPEGDAARVAPGAIVEVIVEAVSDTPFKGRVALISPVIDPQAGTVTVKSLLPNGNQRLKPGMFARVRIVVGSPQRVVTVPESAISQKNGDKAKVFAVVNGRAFVKEIVLGRERNGVFIVLEGLKGGEALIDAPSPLLREGEEVEVD
jgi:RND family efflux transporter MFP subunit